MTAKEDLSAPVFSPQRPEDLSFSHTVLHQDEMAINSSKPINENPQIFDKESSQHTISRSPRGSPPLDEPSLVTRSPSPSNTPSPPRSPNVSPTGTTGLIKPPSPAPRHCKAPLAFSIDKIMEPTPKRVKVTEVSFLRKIFYIL